MCFGWSLNVDVWQTLANLFNKLADVDMTTLETHPECPAEGDVIVVLSFFESQSVAESLLDVIIAVLWRAVVKRVVIKLSFYEFAVLCDIPDDFDLKLCGSFRIMTPHHIAQHRPRGDTTTLCSQKQQLLLGTALSGGWCRHAILELHARNNDDACFFSNYLL